MNIPWMSQGRQTLNTGHTLSSLKTSDSLYIPFQWPIFPGSQVRNPESLGALPLSRIRSSPILRILPPMSLHPQQPLSPPVPRRWLHLGFLPALDLAHLVPQTHSLTLQQDQSLPVVS